MASRKEYEMLINLVAKYSGSSAISKAQKDIAAIGNEITKLTKLQQQVKALADVRQQMEQLANSGQKDTKEFKQLTTQSNRLTAILNGAGISTQNLAREDENLGNMIYNLRGKQDQLLKAFQEYDAGAQKNTESTEKLEKSLDALVSSQVFAYITEGVKKVMGAFKECVSAQMEFEATMSKVEALSGATGEELDALNQAAKDMGATTVYTAAESSSALSLMALAGWNTTEMLNGLQPILSLAAASEMDMSTATSAVTDNLVAFGLKTEDTSHMVDVMAYAMANSNTTTEQLKDAYKGVAATSKSLGVSLEDTTAILMVLANQGIKSSTAGIALNGIFTRLATNTSKCADILRGYGVEIYDANGNMRNMIDVFSDMSGVWDTLSDKEQAALAKTIAGQRQYNKLQMIMQGLSDEAKASGRSILDFRDALENSEGVAQKMADTMLDNLQGKVTLLSSAFDGLKIAIGEAVSDELSGFVEIATTITSKIRDWAQNNPAAVKTFASMAAALAGVTLALTGATVAQKIYNATLKSIPGLNIIFAITAAIGALSGMLAGLKKDWEAHVTPVKELAKEARELKSAMSDASDGFDDAQASASANSEIVKDYAERLNDLEARQRYVTASGEDATEVNQQYHDTLAELCYLVPEMTEYIDLETDSIKGGTSALLDYADATEKAAISQAYAEYYQKVYKEYADTLVEAATNRAKLGIEEKKQEELAKRKIELQQEEAALLNETTEQLNELDGIGATWTGFSGDSERLAEVRKEMEEIDAELEYSEQNQKNLNKALDEGAAAEKEAKEAIDVAKQAMDEYNNSIKDTSEAADDAADSTRMLSEAEAELKDTAFTEALNERVDTLSAMIQTYEDAYDAAKKSIEGQYALWDTVEEKESTSIETINQNIQKQTEHWQKYNTALDILSQYTGSVDGLNAMLNSFADGSEESAAAVEGMAQGIEGLDEKAAAEKLQTMTDGWLDLQKEEEEASKKIAETTGITESEIQDMANQVQQTISSMDYSYEAAQAASETFSSYYKTAESWTSNIATLISTKMQEIQKSLNLSGTFQVNTPNVSEEAAENYTGTLSANPGWSLVGEHGPELMQMHGGERVITASQTKALVEHAYSTPGASDGGYTVSIAPTYNISGGDADAVKTVLDQNNANLKQFIVNTIKDVTADNRRRAYA